MFSKTRRSGFTLIELLVVIAIIAILAAILMPVFAQAREKARTASCQSNLKQIMTAIHMYTQDYDETIMPYLWYQIGTTGNWVTWMELVNPYVKNEQVFLCPSAPKTPGEFGLGGNRVASGYVWPGWIPYSFWNWIDGQTGMGGFPSQCPIEHVQCRAGVWTSGNTVKAGILQAAQPAQAAFVYDGAMTTFYPSTQNTNLVFGSANTAATSFTWTDRRHYRHNGGANVGFSDGHVKWMRGERLWLDMSARTATTNRRLNVNMRVGE